MNDIFPCNACQAPTDVEQDFYCFHCLSLLPVDLRQDIRWLINQDLERDLDEDEESTLEARILEAQLYLEDLPGQPLVPATRVVQFMNLTHSLN